MIAIQDHLDDLLQLMQKADAAVMKVYSTHSAVVQIKSDNTPLTQADMASHRILVDGLARLFPDIPIVSEEGDEDSNRQIVQGKTFWLVDPLDGTKEFIKRTDEFTICAALIDDDVPYFGIISAPALGVIYYGGTCIGSYKKYTGKDEERISRPDGKAGVVLGSRSFVEPETNAYIAAHFAGAEVRAVGSQLKLPYVAEGKADAYPRLATSMKLWDLAAGHAILEGAGGKVTRPDGSPIDYHAQSLLVGDFVALA